MMRLPPGPRLSWPRQVWQYAHHPLPLLDRCAAEFGDLFTLRLGSLGTLVVVQTPEHVRQVFLGDPHVLRAGESNRLAKPIVGENSIFVMDGERHLKKRRMLLPPFHGERLLGYAEAIARTTDRYLTRWRPGQSLRLHSELYDITLDVILEVVFGLQAEGDREALRAALVRLFAPTPPIASFVPELLADFPGSPFWFWLERRKKVVNMLERWVEARRADPRLDQRSDVLAVLLLARDEQHEALSLGELVDQLITTIVAGHETTATALSWAMERVLCHPDIEQRLRNELSGSDALAALENTYLDTVLTEVLRTRPIFPLIARALAAPFQIADYELPPGIILAPCLYLTHKRPDAYPEPERFLPERWEGKRPDPYLYYPFGGGSRRCLGMAFALMEMKIILARVMRHAALRLEPKGPLPVTRRTITLFPQGGTRVMVERLLAS